MKNEISLSKFLSRYGYLTGKDLKNVTHEEVKELFPEFKRSSFKEIDKNPELLITGKIILVNDGRKTIPYYARIQEKEEYTIVERESVEKRKIDDEIYDYTSMSLYELRLLLRKRFNSVRNQNCARKEIEKRGIVLSKKYNRCKFKRKMEE